jgi:prepilin-type N-terminal cleavage/methylation domain-containing protein
MTGNKINKGFTVNELLVVMAIIGILSLVIIPSYKNAKEQLALERSAVQLAQYLAKAREMAMSTQECVPCGNIFPPGGYGIYMRDTPIVQRTYILFADMDNDQKYNPVQDIQIEEIILENKVGIYDLSKNIINIGFKPPDPTVVLSGKDPADPAFINFSSLSITIALDNNPTRQKIITLNAVGLIDIN